MIATIFWNKMVISANETDQTDECLLVKNGMKPAYAE